MLEKPSAQDIAMHENQGKQCWKSLKINQNIDFEKKKQKTKKTGDDEKKTKILKYKF